MTEHKDGTYCAGGGFNPPVFASTMECPLCAQYEANRSTEDAASRLRNLARITGSDDAQKIADELRTIFYRIERLTWEKKGGVS